MTFLPSFAIATTLLWGVCPAWGDGWRPDWTAVEVAPGGRIDAVADLGEGVLLAGSRNPLPGRLYRSIDCGESWTDLGNLFGDDPIASSVTCLASGGDGQAYLLTGDSQVFRSGDWGLTWKAAGRPSRNPRRTPFLQSYSLTVLPTGTVLVSDTNPEGGHVFRSTDGGESWEDVGPVSDDALYRFEKTPDGAIVNGWAGRVYKSTDDGRTWSNRGRLCEGPLYATERLDNGVLLQGSESGEIFRSLDEGETWERVAVLSGAGDDFASLGEAAAVYSVYTEGRNVYVTLDGGMTWVDTGALSTGPEDDVLDHVVTASCADGRRVVGGTKRGWIVWARTEVGVQGEE